MYSFLLQPSHQQSALQELAVYLECRRLIYWLDRNDLNYNYTKKEMK